MKPLFLLLCLGSLHGFTQTISMGPTKQVKEYENQSEKISTISLSEDFGKAGFDTKFKYILGYSNELKSYYFRLVEYRPELAKGFYYSVVFGESGKYYTAQELGLSFEEPVINTISITGIWQYKGKEYKGNPTNLTVQNGTNQTKIPLTPPTNFSTNEVFRGAVKLVDVQFNSWDISDKNKWLDLIESRLKK